MRTVRDSLYVDPAMRGAAAAIGNFDGVHLGHQALIDRARAVAADTGAPLGVVTFEPHPREVFAPDSPPFRLMNAAARAHRLEKLGVERLYELSFTADLAALTPEAFATEILAHRLGLAHAVVGADFRFGKDRAGTAEILADLGDTLGFGTTIVPLLAENGTRVSSTAIRTALTEGRPRDAAAMLGHWHRLEGTVIRGDQRGRTLGFPTANISIDGLHPPRFGVYATFADVLDGPLQGRYRAASSIGTRPMFGENRPNAETHLFDFSGDLYGATLSVALVDWLRPEQTFPSLESFIDQMKADCAQAREILADA